MTEIEKFLERLEKLKTDMEDHPHDDEFYRFPLGTDALVEIKRDFHEIYDSLKEQGLLKENREVHAICIVLKKQDLA